MVPTNTSNYANITGGFITGTVQDELTVQPNTSGVGGEVFLQISGSATIDMTLHKVNYLAITPNYSGDLVIEELTGGLDFANMSGTVTVSNARNDAGDIVIRSNGPISGQIVVSNITPAEVFSVGFNAGMTSTGLLSLGQSEGPIHIGMVTRMEGTIELLDGIPNDSFVEISAPFTGVIDLNNIGIAPGGSLNLPVGGSGSVIDGGSVGGSVTLGGSTTPFTGTASFSEVTAGAHVTLNGTGTLNISKTLRGDLCGTNLSATQYPPSNVKIGCGIGTEGTICGGEPVCPAGSITTAAPLSGTKDARQPHPVNNSALSARQGLASPNAGARAEDKLNLTLSVSAIRALNHDCWSVCETNIEAVDTGTAPLSANKIACIKEPTVVGQPYEIQLERPISGGQWTTIEYDGGGIASYASLPGDFNGSSAVNGADLLDCIDCLNGVTAKCPPTIYGKDMDHSGVFNSADYVTLADLMNGAGTFIVWNGKSLPSNSCIDGGGMAPMSAGFEGAEEAFEAELTADQFADWTVGFLTAADPADETALADFDLYVAGLTQWALQNLDAPGRAGVADRLRDPGLAFASDVGADAAANMAADLNP